MCRYFVGVICVLILLCYLIGIDDEDMAVADGAADDSMPPLEEDDDSAKMEEVD